MPEDKERLARIEALVEKNHETTVMMRGELKDHMAKEERKAEQTDARLDAVELEQERVKTHFKWLHGVWAAFSATIVGWMSQK